MPAQLSVAGVPYYIASLLDDTNFADAAWNTFVSTNITVNLGTAPAQGWHNVWIGLRGHADDTNTVVWSWKRLKYDTVPPQVVITGPTNPIVNVPMIQLTGYSPEELGGISYDLTNAVGLVTNQPVQVLNRFYDPTTHEFTTNTFQAFDIPLTNGLNIIHPPRDRFGGQHLDVDDQFHAGLRQHDQSGGQNILAVRMAL